METQILDRKGGSGSEAQFVFQNCKFSKTALLVFI